MRLQGSQNLTRSAGGALSRWPSTSSSGSCSGPLQATKPPGGLREHRFGHPRPRPGSPRLRAVRPTPARPPCHRPRAGGPPPHTGGAQFAERRARCRHRRADPRPYDLIVGIQRSEIDGALKALPGARRRHARGCLHARFVSPDRPSMRVGAARGSPSAVAIALHEAAHPLAAMMRSVARVSLVPDTNTFGRCALGPLAVPMMSVASTPLLACECRSRSSFPSLRSARRRTTGRLSLIGGQRGTGREPPARCRGPLLE